MKNIQRFLISIAVALIVAGGTYLVARAQGGTVTSTPQVTVTGEQPQIDCSVCHSQFTDAWAGGAHGHSMVDTKFTEMWTDQGKPGQCLVCHATGYDPATGSVEVNAVSCADCHNPIPPNHSTAPTENPVPVDNTTALCSRCHSDPRFGLSEFQTSAHYQVGMTCTVCHDPHTAALKTVPGMEDKGPSGLCINCHNQVAMNFPYSIHAQAGLSCVDCHLLGGQQTKTNADVHAMPDHSFSASLDTCNACHSDQMHTEGTPIITTTSGTTPSTQATPSATSTPVIAEKPAPVSPAGFSGLAGLLGLAGGMVLQPWLERLYRRLNSKKGEADEQKKDKSS